MNTPDLTAYGYQPLFGCRDTLAEAMNYLQDIAVGAPEPSHVITAAMVYANTLIKVQYQNGLLTPQENHDEPK